MRVPLCTLQYLESNAAMGTVTVTSKVGGVESAMRFKFNEEDYPTMAIIVERLQAYTESDDESDS